MPGLEPFTEVCGEIASVTLASDTVTLKLITVELSYSVHSREGQELLKLKNHVGKRVSILLTDNGMLVR